MTRVWATIGHQLRYPSGPAGTILGCLMSLANRESNRIAVDALRITPHDTVLELGFGPGRAIKMLAARAPHGLVLGIDHSAAMFAQASLHNRRAIRQGLVRLVLGRFDALPWRANSIDKILAVHVVYFASVFAIREARRALRQNGSIAIIAVDKCAMARWKFTQFSTHTIFDSADLAALLGRAGFSTCEIAIQRIALPFGIPGLLAIATKFKAADILY